MADRSDIDAQETREWLDALDAVLEHEGVERAHYLLERLIDKARRSGAYLPFSANTAYINTICRSETFQLSRHTQILGSIFTQQESHIGYFLQIPRTYLTANLCHHR